MVSISFLHFFSNKKFCFQFLFHGLDSIGILYLSVLECCMLCVVFLNRNTTVSKHTPQMNSYTFTLPSIVENICSVRKSAKKIRVSVCKCHSTSLISAGPNSRSLAKPSDSIDLIRIEIQQKPTFKRKFNVL